MLGFPVPRLVALTQADLTICYTVYRACESSTDGHAESTAGFISRFFQLCLRAVCTPPTAPASPTAATTALGTDAAFSFSQSSQVRLTSLAFAPRKKEASKLMAALQSMIHNSFDPTPAPLIGFDDASYWWVASYLILASTVLIGLLHQGIAFPRSVNGLELAGSITRRKSTCSCAIVNNGSGPIELLFSQSESPSSGLRIQREARCWSSACRIQT